MFFVQSANLLHSFMVTMFTQQYPWQRLSTPRDVSIVTDLTHSVYDLVFFFIDAYCACLVTRFVGMVTVLTRLPWQHISPRKKPRRYRHLLRDLDTTSGGPRGSMLKTLYITDSKGLKTLDRNRVSPGFFSPCELALKVIHTELRRKRTRTATFLSQIFYHLHFRPSC